MYVIPLSMVRPLCTGLILHLLTHLFGISCSHTVFHEGCFLITFFQFVSNINLMSDVFTINFNFLQVFSAFGFVHKIATFEKAAGFQVSATYRCSL